MVLRYLRGHPSIPQVLAFGKIDHFEYLALELLGPSIFDFINARALLDEEILLIASDMVSSSSQEQSFRINLESDLRIQIYSSQRLNMYIARMPSIET